MFNLFTSYFHDGNAARQEELREVLQRNIELKAIDRIYLLMDQPIEKCVAVPCHKKITHIYLRSRPYYNTLFHLIGEVSSDDCWNCIANSDIYFDETIRLCPRYGTNVCLALTRYEVKANGVEFLNRKDSQDCWIFRGKPRGIKGDFVMGIPGCDNAIAWRFEQAGYRVINPSLTIRTYHLHRTNKRNYDVNNKVPQPYKLIPPTR